MTKYQENLDGKTCLVTGGTGFIGSYLCAKLYSLGAHVISVDIEEAKDGTLFNLLNKNNKIRTLTADLADSSNISKISKLKPDYIYHLAGLPYAPYTSIHPASAFNANVSSTANMLEVARNISTDRFVLASSACVFGATIDSPIPINGKRCKAEHYYTYTKRQAEYTAESYNEFYSVPISICRFVNIYGPGDRHFGRLIPALCKQLIESISQELTLFRSSGESVFEFLYVEDAVSGLLAAAQDGCADCGISHFGPGHSARVKTREVAHKLSLIYDNRKRKLITKNHGGEKTVEKYLDTSDTMKNIGWEPQWNFDEGLSKTIRWYRENIRKIKPANYAIHNM